MTHLSRQNRCVQSQTGRHRGSLNSHLLLMINHKNMKNIKHRESNRITTGPLKYWWHIWTKQTKKKKHKNRQNKKKTQNVIIQREQLTMIICFSNNLSALTHLWIQYRLVSFGCDLITQGLGWENEAKKNKNISLDLVQLSAKVKQFMIHQQSKLV